MIPFTGTVAMSAGWTSLLADVRVLGEMTTGVLLVVTVLAAIVAGGLVFFLLVRSGQEGDRAVQADLSDSEMEHPEKRPEGGDAGAGPGNPPESTPRDDDAPITEEPDTLSNLSTTPILEHLQGNRIIPRVEDAQKAEEEGDYETAARLWHLRGDLVRECKALGRSDNRLRHLKLLLSTGKPRQAAPLLRQALEGQPQDRDLRLALIQSCLDLEDTESAKRLAEEAEEILGDFPGDHLFFSHVAKAFEACGDFESALKYYSLARQGETGDDEANVRHEYLTSMIALAEGRDTPDSDRRSSEILRRALEAVEDVPTDSMPTPPHSEWSCDNDLLIPHEIFVGHSALGGTSNERRFPARSLFSIPLRFDLVRMLGQNSRTCVFEGVDRLQDCPVAIRLRRIDLDTKEYEALHARFQAIALLNHPNLTKVTFVDRYGPIVRVVSEFYPDGDLVQLMEKLGRIGIGLMVRILMQISAGMAKAHRAGIIHGDLRPENIMIGHDQLIKVSDFALHPWPVRTFDPAETPNVSIPTALKEEEIQIDISQFADVVEFLLNATTSLGTESEEKTTNLREELQELARRARDGSCSSFQNIQRILVQTLDRVISERF